MFTLEHLIKMYFPKSFHMGSGKWKIVRNPTYFKMWLLLLLSIAWQKHTYMKKTLKQLAYIYEEKPETTIYMLLNRTFN